MQRSPRALSLARALIALARSRRTGVLTVRGELEQCQVAMVDGVPRAIASTRGGELLGDVLLRAGDLDVSAHLRALDVSAPEHPVGDWLVRAGVSSRPAVEHALRHQLRAKLVRVLSWAEPEYTFEPGAADVSVPWVREPVAACDLVLSALRARLTSADVQRFVAAHTASQLSLAELGRYLAREATWWPEEAALMRCLERPVQLAELHALAAGGPRALGMLALLVQLGAVSVTSARAASYPTLLRKQRQLRRSASSRELLDVSADASMSEVRRALRRLAQEVHPDALGPCVPDALLRASNEVMTGLAEAERELRTASRPTRRER